LQTARSVITDREVANLADEAELRAFELVNEFRFLRKDVRDLANPGSAYDDSTRSFPTVALLRALFRERLKYDAPRAAGAPGGRPEPEATPEQARAKLLGKFDEVLRQKDY